MVLIENGWQGQRSIHRDPVLMGRGAGCGGARTSNLRTDNLHVEVHLALGAAAAARPKRRCTSESDEAERATQKKEKKTLQEKLNEQGLRLVKIKADGHCLFSAINDQLKRSAPHAPNRQHTYKTLRHAAADFMLQVREVVCRCV